MVPDVGESRLSSGLLLMDQLMAADGSYSFLLPPDVNPGRQQAMTLTLAQPGCCECLRNGPENGQSVTLKISVNFLKVFFFCLFVLFFKKYLFILKERASWLPSTGALPDGHSGLPWVSV